MDTVHKGRPPKQIILDMDSSVTSTYGHREGSAYNGYFQCTCYHPLFCFNQYGDMERTVLRNGNVHSADDWRARRVEIEASIVVSLTVSRAGVPIMVLNGKSRIRLREEQEAVMPNLIVTLVIGAVLIVLAGSVIFRILAMSSSAGKAKLERRTNLPVYGREAIKAALGEALRTEEAVILTDVTSGSLEKFVQFAVEGGKLLLDIPEQQLSEEEQQTLETLPGISKSGGGSYQMQMPDIESAVKVADNVFQSVFRTPAEYELGIEFV